MVDTWITENIGYILKRKIIFIGQILVAKASVLVTIRAKKISMIIAIIILSLLIGRL